VATVEQHEESIVGYGNRVKTFWGPVIVNDETADATRRIVTVRHDLGSTRIAHVDVWYNADYGPDEDTVRQLVHPAVTVTGPDTIKLHYGYYLPDNSSQYCVAITAVL
jgi:hypothetical protein